MALMGTNEGLELVLLTLVLVSGLQVWSLAPRLTEPIIELGHRLDQGLHRFLRRLQVRRTFADQQRYKALTGGTLHLQQSFRMFLGRTVRLLTILLLNVTYSLAALVAVSLVCPVTAPPLGMMSTAVYTHLGALVLDTALGHILFTSWLLAPSAIMRLLWCIYAMTPMPRGPFNRLTGFAGQHHCMLPSVLWTVLGPGPWESPRGLIQPLYAALEYGLFGLVPRTILLKVFDLALVCAPTNNFLCSLVKYEEFAWLLASPLRFVWSLGAYLVAAWLFEFAPRLTAVPPNVSLMAAPRARPRTLNERRLRAVALKLVLDLLRTLRVVEVLRYPTQQEQRLSALSQRRCLQQARQLVKDLGLLELNDGDKCAKLVQQASRGGAVVLSQQRREALTTLLLGWWPPGVQLPSEVGALGLSPEQISVLSGLKNFKRFSGPVRACGRPPWRFRSLWRPLCHPVGDWTQWFSATLRMTRLVAQPLDVRRGQTHKKLVFRCQIGSVPVAAEASSPAEFVQYVLALVKTFGKKLPADAAQGLARAHELHPCSTDRYFADPQGYAGLLCQSLEREALSTRDLANAELLLAAFGHFCNNRMAEAEKSKNQWLSLRRPVGSAPLQPEYLSAQATQKAEAECRRLKGLLRESDAQLSRLRAQLTRTNVELKSKKEQLADRDRQRRQRAEQLKQSQRRIQERWTREVASREARLQQRQTALRKNREALLVQRELHESRARRFKDVYRKELKCEQADLGSLKQQLARRTERLQAQLLRLRSEVASHATAQSLKHLDQAQDAAIAAFLDVKALSESSAPGQAAKFLEAPGHRAVTSPKHQGGPSASSTGP